MSELIEHLEETGHFVDSNDQPDYLDMIEMDELFAAMNAPELSYSSIISRGVPGVELRRTGDGLLVLGHLTFADMERLLPVAVEAEISPAATADQRAAIQNLVDAVRTAVQLRKDLVLVCP